MSKETVTGVQPALFLWARTSVGLGIDDVAQMLKRKPEEIEAWERGDAAPSYAQLEKLAYQIYKRPLALFFLPEPPQEELPQREFRTLPDTDMRSLARDTYLHIRKAHAYQLALKDIFDSRNPSHRRILEQIYLSPKRDVQEQAQEIRSVLKIEMVRQTGWRNDETALKEWRKAVEEAGIFVFKSHFKQEEISGFCLTDGQFPLIYLNNHTTKTRQIFSLMHELAHLLIRVNGLSKFEFSYIERLARPERELEIFCNAVAAEVLMPAEDFRQQAISAPTNLENASDEFFTAIASRYGVSREAVLRRFLDQKRVGRQFYEQKAKYWAKQKKKTGGGNWYLNQGAYISDRFAKEVVSRHYRQQISLEQAADFLGIKPRNYATLEEQILRGAGA
ncbi:MAG: ImmA/IrrE family metallo-endopeptidase [Azoarcus sp.]|jgi:Zn-dependent peptidase ImmA (M78 family)|nr:ImmA/IrrE family metallo-endopeptidase [Azoarcus sp.]